MKNANRNRRALRSLAEGAVMVALSTALSFLALWHMPQGGAVSLDMLPIFLYAVRWGLGPGLSAGFVMGVLQFLFGGGFALSWQSILGDYLLAFTVVGLAGLFHGRKRGVYFGSLLGGCARFLVHYVVGATVWREYMPERFFGMTMTSPWLYSLLYNSFVFLDVALCLIAFALLEKTMGKYLSGADIRP